MNFRRKAEDLAFCLHSLDKSQTHIISLPNASPADVDQILDAIGRMKPGEVYCTNKPITVLSFDDEGLALLQESLSRAAVEAQD